MSTCAESTNYVACLKERKNEQLRLKFAPQLAPLSVLRSLTFGDEEIEQRQCHRVPAEHVVAARPHALNGHSKPAPDGVGPTHAQVNHFGNFGRAVVEFVVVFGALEVGPWDAQRRNQHRDAPQQEHGAGQGKEPTQQNHSAKKREKEN